jgi:peptidyl-prolyl cis-trans isomerase C
MVACILAAAWAGYVAWAEETPAASAPEPGVSAAVTPPAGVAETVLVEVDGAKFTKGEADAILAERMAMVRDRVPEDRQARFERALRRQIVEEFIDTTLLSNAAREQGVAATDKDVDAFIEKIRSDLGAKASLDDVLRLERTTMADLRKDVEWRLTLKNLVDSKLSGKPPPTDQEIADFHNKQREKFDVPETVHARHILIAVDEDAAPEAIEDASAVAESIRDDLVNGGDFAKLAAANSDCPSRQQGGDLGVFGRGQMVKNFEEAAFSRKPNEIGSVVKTEFGYHVIEVLEHMPERTMTLEEARDIIVRYIQRRRQQEALESLIENLRKEARIVYGKEPQP